MWYHGSNQHFDRWSVDQSIQGMNTQSGTAQGAIYFTDSTILAGQYAEMASRRLFAGNHGDHEQMLADMNTQYNHLMNQRAFDAADALLERLEALDCTLRNDRSGQLIYPAWLKAGRDICVDLRGGRWGAQQDCDLLKMGKDRQLDAIYVLNVVDSPLSDEAEVMNMAIVLNPEIIVNGLDSKPEGAREYPPAEIDNKAGLAL